MRPRRGHLLQHLIVSGMVALMLEANQGLGYRDVQEILAYTAKRVEDGSGIG